MAETVTQALEISIEKNWKKNFGKGSVMSLSEKKWILVFQYSSGFIRLV